MDLKEYLCVDAIDIKWLDYIFTDQDLYGARDEYPKPHCIGVGGGNCIKIFERNGIPEEFQKLFLSCNRYMMQINKIFNSRKGDMCGGRILQFKAIETISNTAVYLSMNGKGSIFGRMEGENPAFEVHHCYVCEKNDVCRFLIDLRSKGLMDNYIQAIKEITHVHMRSYFDSNSDKVMKKTV